MHFSLLANFYTKFYHCFSLGHYGHLTAGGYPKQFQKEKGNLDFEIERGRFVPSPRVSELRNKLLKFMDDHIYPLEKEFYKLAQSSMRWTVHPEEENLKELAKREGLWNLWIPVSIVIYV